MTKREQNRLERRASIVRLARDIFLDQGYEATSMSTIAAMLGGSKATLWNHFTSKEDLFAAVLDDLIEKHRAELESTLRPGRDLRATLLDFCDNFLDRILDPQTIKLNRLVVAEADRFPEVGKLFFERAPQPLMRRLEIYLAESISQGALRGADTGIMADQLIGLTQSTLHQRRLWNVIGEPTTAKRREHIVAAVDTFMLAFGA